MRKTIGFLQILLRSIAIIAVVGIAAIIVLAELGLVQDIFRNIYNFKFGDVVGHLLLFGGLSFILHLAFPITRNKRFPILKGCLFLALFVTLEEVSQIWISSRSFSFLDLTADYLGIFLCGEAGFYLRKTLFVENNQYNHPL